MLQGHIDMAVHSLKDLPTRLPEGLIVGAILEVWVHAICMLCTSLTCRVPIYEFVHFVGIAFANDDSERLQMTQSWSARSTSTAN